MSSTNIPLTLQQADRLRLAISIEEAAQALGIGRTLVFRLIRDGELKVTKIHNRSVVQVEEIRAYLAQLQNGGAR